MQYRSLSCDVLYQRDGSQGLFFFSIRLKDALLAQHTHTHTHTDTHTHTATHTDTHTPTPTHTHTDRQSDTHTHVREEGHLRVSERVMSLCAHVIHLMESGRHQIRSDHG